MKLGSMGVVTLTALAVVCLANAPPARANSIDGSVVYGIMGLDTSLSPNYFDPSTPNTAFNSQWENTSATFQTFDGTTIGAVPISDTAIEFGTHLASNLTLTADFYSGGSGGLNLVFNLPPGIPSTLYLYFADAAFAGLTLTPSDVCSSVAGCNWLPDGTPYSSQSDLYNHIFSTGDGQIILAITTATGDFNENFLFTPVPVTPTPLPAALPLFATGLGGLGLLGWRRKRKAAALAA